MSGIDKAKSSNKTSVLMMVNHGGNQRFVALPIG